MNRVRPSKGVKVTVTCTERSLFLQLVLEVRRGPADETSNTVQ